VEVGYVRIGSLQKRAHIPITVRRPNGLQREPRFAPKPVAFDFVVVPEIHTHLMTGAFQHLALLFENDVFSSRLLIRVVD
jgi:hypothetical protein